MDYEKMLENYIRDMAGYIENAIEGAGDTSVESITDYLNGVRLATLAIAIETSCGCKKHDYETHDMLNYLITHYSGG